MADMSPLAVDRRLRQVATLDQSPRDAPEGSPTPGEALLAARQGEPLRRVSMSPKAVDARLQEVAELRRLCLDLARLELVHQ